MTRSTVWIPMPDGTRLAADLWAAERDSLAPTILEALPYRRRDGTAARDLSVYPHLAKRGFAGLRVDLRGTGDSEGTFDDEYSETELSDIEAVIAWIAAQPWSNGRVGMMGISWGGFNALQVAARAPAPLGAVISIASTTDRFADDIHFKGGAMLSANLYWATQMLGRAALPPDSAVVGEAWRDQWRARLEALEPLHFRWFQEQRRGPYWQRGSICEDYAALQAQTLLIAGWADGYRNTPWKGLEGLGDRARAITGPWVHLYPHFATPAPRLDYLAEAEAWFGRWLDDRPAPDLPAHRLYLSEAVRPEDRRHEPGRWIALGAARPAHRLYPSGNRLHDAPQPETQVPLRSPRDCGLAGGEYFTQGGAQDLPGDQRADDGKSLCFDLPVAAPLDIIGEPVLRLTLALDAPQGNLIARLCDVHPD
ncbi:MAG: CocE/NonD family hydrolase, partial [Pseudomonadota bacterium]